MIRSRSHNPGPNSSPVVLLQESFALMLKDGTCMRVPSMFNLSGDMLTVMIRAAPSFLSLLGLFIRYTDQVLCGFSCCELASIASAPK